MQPPILEVILKYFPDLSHTQQKKYLELGALYKEWNSRLNLISRKDIDAVYERHILHALAIAKVLHFMPKSSVMDVGTGGGIPGIPLAIMFPETKFYLVDSVHKKIVAVQNLIESLELKNATTACIRAEQVAQNFDFVISRAVTNMPQFVEWVKHRCLSTSRHNIKNGILYLKGGDLNEELKPFPKAKIHPIKDYFEEPFFQTKSVVYLPLI